MPSVLHAHPRDHFSCSLGVAHIRIRVRRSAGGFGRCRLGRQFRLLLSNAGRPASRAMRVGVLQPALAPTLPGDRRLQQDRPRRGVPASPAESHDRSDRCSLRLRQNGRRLPRGRTPVQQASQVQRMSRPAWRVVRQGAVTRPNGRVPPRADRRLPTALPNLPDRPSAIRHGRDCRPDKARPNHAARRAPSAALSVQGMMASSRPCKRIRRAVSRERSRRDTSSASISRLIAGGSARTRMGTLSGS